MPPNESNTRPRPKAHNDHNVYILGAGFAAEAGLPLIKDFMNRMRDAAAWLEAQGGRDREVTAIERVLDFRLRAAAAAYRVPLDVENIEELFSLASASGDPELADAMPLAIAATLDYADSEAGVTRESQRLDVGVLNPPTPAPQSWGNPFRQEPFDRGAGVRQWFHCPLYDFYLGVMCGFYSRCDTERRDTIITFNYDTVVEDALRSLGLAVYYGLDEEFLEPDRRVQVLKPHGSVSWWQDATGSTRILATYDESYSDEELSGCAPLLLPPTWSKMLTESIFAEIWDSTVAALRTATRIIILGYSIPPTDPHFKYLLAAGLKDNISLRKVHFVNPALKDADERKTFEERLFGPSGLFRREHLRQGIIELIPVGTREFFTGPHDEPYARLSYRERIGRPLNPWVERTLFGATLRTSDTLYPDA